MANKTENGKRKTENFGKLAIFLAIFLFAGFALVNLNSVGAQETKTPAATPTPTPDEDEVVKIDTDLVNILFTAQDKDRRLLTDLQKNDVRILEDGQPQEIFTFQRQTDLPLSISILIDTSASQERTLPSEKAAAKEFVESVVRPQKDEVSVLTFTGETTLEQDLTGNIDRVRRAIDRVRYVPPSGTISGVMIGTPPISGTNQQIAGSTAIWDAVWITSNEVLGQAPDRTRRVVILMTDGFNTYGNKKLEDAVNEAIRNDAIVYCIGIGDYGSYEGVDESVLRKIAERTGGRAFFPNGDDSQLRRAFEQIQVEMRSQYLLAYQPTNDKRDGTFRKIEIQLVSPALKQQKVKLTHRQGYFAETVPKK